MKLARVRLRNFRCYRDELAIDISGLTALIGKNDCGKSAVLDALQIFFDDSAPDVGDPSVDGDKRDVRIVCEFEDLPRSLVIDAEHPTSLADEYMLNEDGRLEIHKLYDGSLKTPKLKGTFAVARHPTTKGVDDLLQLKSRELKARVSELGVDIQDVDKRVNTELRRALWRSIDDLKLATVEIPLDEETARKVWDQLKKTLPEYALFKTDRPSTDQDAEAQDPMKAAVAAAVRAKQKELEEISEFVGNQVRDMANKTVAKIREMDPELAGQLNPVFTPPKWASVFKISLTGDEDIPINKRGSGVRRLVLMNFFRAEAEERRTKTGAGVVIYAIEEPETSQHPNMQRMLMEAFAELVQSEDCQVILTTHTPALAKGLPLDSLRYIAIEGRNRRIYSGNDETYERVAKALGVLPGHDVKLFIGLEGINDIRLLRNISHVLSAAGEDVPDLVKLEESEHVVFIPVGGSNLVHWSGRFAALRIPEFHLFDRDTAPPEPPRYQQAIDEINSLLRCEATHTQKREIENYIHPKAIKAVWPNVQIKFGDYDDVPSLIAEAIHMASESDASWEELTENKRKKKTDRVKLRLSSEAATAMTPELLNETDPSGEMRAWLRKIGQLVTG